MSERPAPFTPPALDLRDFPYLPLDVVRLRDSALAGIADPEAFRASVLAWCVAWHQVPAASLPDEDAALARLLGFGRDVKTWRAVRRAGGLHGWIKCADGRLYHPVVAEKALIAEERREAQRSRTEAARQAAIRRRAEADTAIGESADGAGDGDATDRFAGAVPLEALSPKSAPSTDPMTAAATESVTDAVTESVAESVAATKPSGVNESQAKRSHRRSIPAKAKRPGSPSASDSTAKAKPAERDPNQAGTGQAIPAQASVATTGAGKSAKRSKGRLGAEMPELRAQLLAAAAAPADWPLLTRTNLEPIPKLIAEGHDLDLDVLPTIAAIADAARHAKRPIVISSWQYFERSIRLARADRIAASRTLAAPVAPGHVAATGTGAAATMASRTFIARRDPRFAALRERWRQGTGRDLPIVAGPGGPGWYFERGWLAAGGGTPSTSAEAVEPAAGTLADPASTGGGEPC